MFRRHIPRPSNAMNQSKVSLGHNGTEHSCFSFSSSHIICQINPLNPSRLLQPAQTPLTHKVIGIHGRQFAKEELDIEFIPAELRQVALLSNKIIILHALNPHQTAPEDSESALKRPRILEPAPRANGRPILESCELAQPSLSKQDPTIPYWPTNRDSLNLIEDLDSPSRL